MCVTGSLVAGAGLLLASYTASVTQLLVTYSLVTGLGFLFLAHTSSEVSSPVSSCRSSLSSVHTTGLPTSRATCRSQGRKSCE